MPSELELLTWEQEKLAKYLHRKACRSAWRRMRTFESRTNYMVTTFKIACMVGTKVEMPKVRRVKAKPEQQPQEEEKQQYPPGHWCKKLLQMAPHLSGILLLGLSCSNLAIQPKASAVQETKGLMATEEDIAYSNSTYASALTASLGGAAVVLALSRTAMVYPRQPKVTKVAGIRALADSKGGKVGPGVKMLFHIKKAMLRGEGLQFLTDSFKGYAGTHALLRAARATEMRPKARSTPLETEGLKMLGDALSQCSTTSKLHGMHHLLNASGQPVACQCVERDWVRFPPPTNPPKTEDIRKVLSSPEGANFPVLRLLLQLEERKPDGMTRKEVTDALFRDQQIRDEEKKRRREADLAIIKERRAMGEESKKARMERMRQEVEKTRDRLKQDEEEMKKKHDELVLSQQKQAFALRQAEELHLKSSQLFDRQIESRLRIQFKEQDMRDVLFNEMKKNEVFAAAAAEKSRLEAELRSKREQFQLEVSKVRQRTAEEQMQKRVVEKWKEEAMRLYIERAYEKMPQTQKLTREAQVLLMKYTLREERNSQLKKDDQQIKELREAISSTFANTEQARLRDAIHAKERMMRVDQVRKEVKAAREAQETSKHSSP
eukprot:Sspe_Gene.14092::Locus_4865_Transcript_1_1_Confidence_1.000_Length_2141::g.14092::m.14092